MNNSLYGNYRTRKFTDIYPLAADFLMEYKNNGIPVTIDETSASTLFYLLYARYGNSHIASSDEDQFRYKLFATIFMYGPAWEKRLKLQEDARLLTVEQVMEDGGKAIYNHAYNPSSAPSTQATNELEYVNDQNVTKYKKSRVDSIAIINSLIETDVTEEFISKFKKLFLVIVEPQQPLWYVTEEGGIR